MGNLLAHFEPSELVDFMNFIGLLIFRLNVSELAQFLRHLIDILLERTLRRSRSVNWSAEFAHHIPAFATYLRDRR